jgi:1,4-dihydroxy-2-naphthoate octaprenyltransferase
MTKTTKEINPWLLSIGRMLIITLIVLCPWFLQNEQHLRTGKVTLAFLFSALNSAHIFMVL